jgi:hypothetical protein
MNYVILKEYKKKKQIDFIKIINFSVFLSVKRQISFVYYLKFYISLSHFKI